MVSPAARMGVGFAKSLSKEDADLQIGDLLKALEKDPVHPTAYDKLAEMLLSKAN